MNYRGCPWISLLTNLEEGCTETSLSSEKQIPSLKLSDLCDQSTNDRVQLDNLPFPFFSCWSRTRPGDGVPVPGSPLQLGAAVAAEIAITVPDLAGVGRRHAAPASLDTKIHKLFTADLN